MAKDPAFLFYPGDYLRDTQTLSEKTQVAYDRIMCEHMRNICITQQQLKFFTKRLNSDEIEELMFTLKKVNGGFQIEWVAESIEKRRSYSESRRENRKGKSKKDMLTYDKHMENENEDENTNKDINAIYSLYPSKCPIKNSSTGKTKTNKNKISKLLKEYSKDELVSKINLYIEDCKKHKVFIKNFSTFLNNLPDDGLSIVDDSMKTFTLSCFGHLSKIKASTLEEAKEIFSQNNGIIPHDQIKVG